MSSLAAIDVRLRLHPGVQVLADEWSGISDPAVRRKLQNRLNKRNSRRRKAGQQQGLDLDEDAFVAAPDPTTAARINQYSGLSSRIASCSAADGALSRQQALAGRLGIERIEEDRSRDAEADTKAARLAVLMEKRPAFLHYFESQVLPSADPYAHYPLPADHLLSLVYYNVYRALVANTLMLGLDLDLVCTEDYSSPFTAQSGNEELIASLPRNYRPTYLQTTIPHHPQWDVFPDPVLRDNALLRGEENIDDVELALDLLGDDSSAVGDEDTQSRTGMIVWGEPSDIMSWEVTEKFARKYPWFLIGAYTLLRSTNEWRRKRGAPPIKFT